MPRAANAPRPHRRELLPPDRTMPTDVPPPDEQALHEDTMVLYLARERLLDAG